MSQLIALPSGKRPPVDLAEKLRALADRVDAGMITSLECAYIDSDMYTFLHAASAQEGLVLASLLHAASLERFQA